MFKPARMTRVLIGGHKARMGDVIDVLHAEGAIHLEDFEDPTTSTQVGTPLAAGDEASALLVRVRGLQKALGTDNARGQAAPITDPAKELAAAETEVGPVVAEIQEARDERADLLTEQRILRPFIDVDVELSLLTGMKTLHAYMGTVRDDPSDALKEAGIDHELGQAGNHIILVVPKHKIEGTDRVLAEHGYQASAIPEGASGTPAERLAEIEQALGRVDERIERVEGRIRSHAEQWGGRLATLENHLVTLVDKTQAPLHFGVTATTFHAEGWIPTDRVNRVRNALSAQFGDAIYFEADDHATQGDHDEHAAHGPEHEPPVQMVNKGLAKPYEFMVGLLGRPRYNELDPTKLMLIFFPLFFGLMVGDVVVGFAIVLFGLYLKKNAIFGIGGPSVGRALVMGGVLAMACGLVVFGEGLGIHFVVDDHAIEEGELSWESIIYGTHTVNNHTVLKGHFPTEGFIYKTSHAKDGDAMAGDGMTDQAHAAPDVLDASFATMAESEEAHSSPFTFKPHSDTHLSVGGYFNLGYYSKIHDVVPLLMWSIVIAIVHLVLGLLLGFRNVYRDHGMSLAIQEKASWLGILAATGIIGWSVATNAGNTWFYGGVGLFAFSVALLWMGVQHTVGVGFIALLEVPSLFGNILSYTRLAAIGASKAGMAIAFSAIGALLGGGLLTVTWWIIYIFGMIVITLLAILSGGLQSLRLQFVEFFQKFYTGGGRPYVPFGRRRASPP